MTAKTTDTIAFDYSQFEDDLETSNRIPWAQMVNPANISQSKLEADPDFGLFLTDEQAELAGFRPNEHWVRSTQEFGSNKVDGYLTRKIRVCVIHRSRKEVQEKTAFGWKTKGLAYIGREASEWKLMLEREKETKKEGDEAKYREVTRTLLAFLNPDNSLMHESPIQLTTRGGFMQSLFNMEGGELIDLYNNIDKVYVKEATAKGLKLKGNRLSAAKKALAVLDCDLWFYRSDSKRSPILCPATRLAAAIDNVGVEKEVERYGSRKIKLIGVPLSQVLLTPNSPSGEIISAWYEQYMSFQDIQNKLESVIKAVGHFGETRYNSEGTCVFAPFHVHETGEILNTFLPINTDILDLSAPIEIVGVKQSNGMVNVSSATSLSSTEVDEF